MEPAAHGSHSPLQDGSEQRSPVDHNEDASDAIDTESGEFSPLTPPHWLHRRQESYASVVDNKPAPITLEDHTEGPSEEQDAVWAKAIYIEDYVIISGSVPSVGSFVIWHCRIDTIDGGSMILRKRYSEFHELRQKLLLTFPKSEGAMPPFPPKSTICKRSKCDPSKAFWTDRTLDKFRPSFLEKRRIGLGYWLTWVIGSATESHLVLIDV